LRESVRELVDVEETVIPFNSGTADAMEVDA